MRAGQHEVGPAAQLTLDGCAMPHDAHTDLAVGKQPVSQHALDVVRVVDDELLTRAKRITDEWIHPGMRKDDDLGVADRGPGRLHEFGRLVRQQRKRRVNHCLAAGELTPAVRLREVPIAQRNIDLPERGGQLMIAVARARPVVGPEVGRRQMRTQRVVQTQQPESTAAVGGLDRLHVEHGDIQARIGLGDGSRLSRGRDAPTGGASGPCAWEPAPMLLRR